MNDGLDTRLVHAGEGRGKAYDAVVMPIVHTSTYSFGSSEEIERFVQQKEAGRADLRGEYGRYGNPTQRAAEEKLACLACGERALLFSSGMAAITTTLLSLLNQGDHLIIASSTYRQTRNFVLEHLARWGIEATFLEDGAIDALEANLRPNTRLIFCEVPTNPYLRVIDLDRLVDIAKPQGILTAIDSTFATPVNLRPLEHGIDLELHSATKYLGGHNDLIAGVAVGSRELTSRLAVLRGILGCVGSPHDAYALLRGLKTLSLRVEKQNQSAQRVAEFLESHARVSRVYYPGLESHPDTRIAKQLLSGYGGVVSFEVKGTREMASKVIDNLRIPFIGPTLGGVESIAQQQAVFISSDPAKRASYGISDQLIRYAVGIENAEDLIADLRTALDAAGSTQEVES